VPLFEKSLVDSSLVTTLIDWEKCGENFVHFPKKSDFFSKWEFFTQIC
jgi:hypothetical protein